jgi:hypothetical protein
MPTQILPAASLRSAQRLPAARTLLRAANYLICTALWSIGRAICRVASNFLPALREGCRYQAASSTLDDAPRTLVFRRGRWFARRGASFCRCDESPLNRAPCGGSSALAMPRWRGTRRRSELGRPGLR